jgi:hypothetical protein
MSSASLSKGHNISLFNTLSQSPLVAKSLKHKGLIAVSWRSTNRPAIQSLAPDTSFKHKIKRCRLRSNTIGHRRTELCSETLLPRLNQSIAYGEYYPVLYFLTGTSTSVHLAPVKGFVYEVLCELSYLIASAR